MYKKSIESKKQKKNLVYLLTILVLFILFVFMGYINESLGMLMFGILVFYVILGNNNYNVEHKAYEEILQSKRELLNYDKNKEKNIQKKDNETHASKWHLLVVVLMIGVAYLFSFINMECAIIVFGLMICYIFFVI